jgi:hypothetical protein
VVAKAATASFFFAQNRFLLSDSGIKVSTSQSGLTQQDLAKGITKDGK